MGTTRRIRNLAFLGLLTTLLWAGPVTLRADSGGYYCGYGDCTILWTDCPGTWTHWIYPDPGPGSEIIYPGECVVRYEPASTGGCDVNDPEYVSVDVNGGLYYWAGPEEHAGDYYWACFQDYVGR